MIIFCPARRAELPSLRIRTLIETISAPFSRLCVQAISADALFQQVGRRSRRPPAQGSFAGAQPTSPISESNYNLDEKRREDSKKETGQAFTGHLVVTLTSQDVFRVCV